MSNGSSLLVFGFYNNISFKDFSQETGTYMRWAKFSLKFHKKKNASIYTSQGGIFILVQSLCQGFLCGLGDIFIPTLASQRKGSKRK